MSRLLALPALILVPAILLSPGEPPERPKGPDVLAAERERPKFDSIQLDDICDDAQWPAWSEIARFRR